MTYEQAEALLTQVLAPLTTDQFFEVVGRTSFNLKGSPSHPRRQLLGDDPKGALLGGFLTHSTKLDWHSKNATQPPPAARAVSNADEYLDLIRNFHKRGYTVRIPDVVPLGPNLQHFARALEFALRQPVEASVFWSAAGAQAIIHYDKPDNLIVHLEGKKRWFISTDPPGRQNKWSQVGEAKPNLERHTVIDVEPGDLIYIPGGTPHTVESTTESLHLAIVFEPITVREAIIAAVDYLSDNDRTLREPAVGRLQDLDLERVASLVAGGLQRVMANSRSQDFLKAALDLRASRMTANLPAQPKTPSAGITRDTPIRHSPLAISHLRVSMGSLDFTVPGEHIAVHRGVEPELQFIASTASFRVADLPGASAEEVKIALVTRLVESGFLEVAISERGA